MTKAPSGERLRPIATAVLMLGCVIHAPLLRAGDAKAGADVFKSECSECHSTRQGHNKKGPSLFGIVGRPAGSLPDYNYSDALRHAPPGEPLLGPPACGLAALDVPRADLRVPELGAFEHPSGVATEPHQQDPHPSCGRRVLGQRLDRIAGRCPERHKRHHALGDGPVRCEGAKPFSGCLSLRQAVVVSARC